MKYARSKKTGINPMQEEFCRHIAAGKKPTEAARLVGAKDPKTYGYRNLKREEVIARIDVLKEGAKKAIQYEFGYTAKESFECFEEIKKKALQDKQYSAAIQAERSKGELAGLYDKKQDINAKDITVTIKTSADLKKTGEDNEI